MSQTAKPPILLHKIKTNKTYWGILIIAKSWLIETVNSIEIERFLMILWHFSQKNNDLYRLFSGTTKAVVDIAIKFPKIARFQKI